MPPERSTATDADYRSGLAEQQLRADLNCGAIRDLPRTSAVMCGKCVVQPRDSRQSEVVHSPELTERLAPRNCPPQAALGLRPPKAGWQPPLWTRSLVPA